MNFFEGQHVLILGLGHSGLAMARWCASCGAKVIAADTRAHPPGLEDLLRDYPDARFVPGAFTPDLLTVQSNDADESELVPASAQSYVKAVFKSPGLSPDDVQSVWQAAQSIGLWVGNELSLFAHALAHLKSSIGYEPTVIAITGTNGKTTVTSLTNQMLLRGGLRSVSAGNIGPTMLGTLQSELALRKAHNDEYGIVDEPPKKPEKAVLFADIETPSDGESETDGANEPDVSIHSVSEEGLETPQSSISELSTLPNGAEHLATSTEEPSQHSHALSDEFSDVSSNPSSSASSNAAIDAAVDELVASVLSTNKTPQPLDQVQAEEVDDRPRYLLPQAWVLELSSFQLCDSDGFDPSSAVILNITEDHLDWHGDMNGYIQAKAKIFGKHTSMILCRDDPHVMQLRPSEMLEKDRKKAKALAEQNAEEWFEPEVITFGSDVPSVAGDYGLESVNGMTWLVRAVDPNEDESERKSRRKKQPTQADELLIHRLMPADALRIRGSHNALNALAALALCETTKGAKLGHGPMLYALREYRGEPHRVEPVARIHDVEYFDDSKGTNVGATLAAIKGLGPEFSLIVILGGVGKGQDFSPLAEPLARHAKLVILIGRDAPLIEQALEGHSIKTQHAVSMQEAVQIAHQHATFGDAVLMSPACASFDMFDNYEHRARVFVQAVQELALDEGVV
jgi:UDP-N-acetylmuramoylalanine--D-glutamate ligase